MNPLKVKVAANSETAYTYSMRLLGENLSAVLGGVITDMQYKVVSMITGHTITPLTPYSTFTYISDFDDVPISGHRYQYDSITVDVVEFTYGIRIVWSSHTSTPDNVLDTVGMLVEEPDDTIPPIHVIVLRGDSNSNRLVDHVRETPYVRGVRHGVKTKIVSYENSLTILQRHYDNNCLHNPRGAAVRTIENGDLSNEYWIHVDRIPSDEVTPDMLTALHTTNPDTLIQLVSHPQSNVAYFAAHNPHCPDEAKIEYALLKKVYS